MATRGAHALDGEDQLGGQRLGEVAGIGRRIAAGHVDEIERLEHGSEGSGRRASCGFAVPWTTRSTIASTWSADGAGR